MIVIEFLEPIMGQNAVELESMCPMKVFDIEDLGGIPTAKVARPRNCTMCRECIRKDGWNEKVKLRRKADHFLFSVESSGCIPPVDIIKEVTLAFLISCYFLFSNDLPSGNIDSPRKSTKVWTAS